MWPRDRFEWELVAPGSFLSRLDVMCTHSIFPNSYSLYHDAPGSNECDWPQGENAEKGVHGWVPNSFLQNHVIWADSDRTARIRYSCQKDSYLGVPELSSLQIWTRAPVSPESDQGPFEASSRTCGVQ